MTIRLLCAYGKFPANAIVTLDAATEAGLVSAKQASLNTVGGDVYFSDVIASAPVPAMAGGQPVTLKMGERTIVVLPEGSVLNVSGSAGTAGVVYRLDPMLGGTNSLQSWTVGAGALAPIGPFAGRQSFLLTCSAGSMSAESQ
ncbi:hypothetical protein, partial [Janthinobacterium sp. UMAB-56]|uniref:hypothetical protein n=1 Tax=Janthinobacterium sp. UMAB-56 TaxID=1365361 RepID=UPI001C596426